METEDMLPVLERLDNAGFYRVEVWGGATFDACIRYLNEDPWERLKKIKDKMSRTPISMLLRGQNLVGFRPYPDDIVERFVERAAASGIEVFVIFDILNDLRNCETAIRAVKKAGKVAEGQISYAEGPVYTVNLWIKLAKTFEDMGVESIHIEDGSGIMTPQTSYHLIKSLKKEIKIPIHLHCHCPTGLAELAYWEAIRAGVDVIDVDTSALSRGPALPPVETFVMAPKNTSRDTSLDLQLLKEVNRYFLSIRPKYKRFETSFTIIDVDVFKHQVPGGMLSNLESQLRSMRASDKLESILKEIQIVRREFGYPPMGTPLAQIIGAQATTNVLTGKRYGTVLKETKDYFRGLYGKPPGQVDPEIEKKSAW